MRTARAAAAIVVAVAALALVAVVARSGRTPTITAVTTPSGEPTVTVTGTLVTTPSASPTPPDPSRWVIPGTIFTVLALLALAYLLGFWMMMLRRSRGGRRWWWIPGQWRRRSHGAEPDPVLAGALATAADAGLRRIEEGEPRDAVIACWVLLERAAADAGTPRRPAETSAELTARMLTEQRVTADVLSELADLYRQARYSGHRLGEDERARARAALAQTHEELTGRPVVQ